MGEKLKTLKDFYEPEESISESDNIRDKQICFTKENLKQETIKWIKSKSNILKPYWNKNEEIGWIVESTRGMDILELAELKGAISEKIRFFNISEKDLKSEKKTPINYFHGGELKILKNGKPLSTKELQDFLKEVSKGIIKDLK